MGGRIAILSAPPSDAEAVVLLGEIGNAGVHYAKGHGVIGGPGARELKRLLGDGYGRITFHMELDGVRLEHCQVVSPKMVFTYRSERPIGALDYEDDSDTYVTHVDELVGPVDASPDPFTVEAIDDDGPDTWPEYELPE